MIVNTDTFWNPCNKAKEDCFEHNATNVYLFIYQSHTTTS